VSGPNIFAGEHRQARWPRCATPPIPAGRWGTLEFVAAFGTINLAATGSAKRRPPQEARSGFQAARLRVCCLVRQDQNVVNVPTVPGIPVGGALYFGCVCAARRRFSKRKACLSQPSKLP
jgi:hypothetical protein